MPDVCDCLRLWSDGRKPKKYNAVLYPVEKMKECLPDKQQGMDPNKNLAVAVAKLEKNLFRGGDKKRLANVIIHLAPKLRRIANDSG